MKVILHTIVILFEDSCNRMQRIKSFKGLWNLNTPAQLDLQGPLFLANRLFYTGPRWQYLYKPYDDTDVMRLLAVFRCAQPLQTQHFGCVYGGNVMMYSCF